MVLRNRFVAIHPGLPEGDPSGKGRQKAWACTLASDGESEDLLGFPRFRSRVTLPLEFKSAGKLVVLPVLRKTLIRCGVYHGMRDRLYRNHADVGVRNRQQRAFYSKLIQPNDLVFDVGANVGQRTAIFASLARRVIAFEPDKRALKELGPRFQFSRKVVLEPLALGAKKGEQKLYCCETDALSSLSSEYLDRVAKYFPRSTWDHSYAVDVSTLDLMIEKHGVPGFIKIDVEGFELKVFGGLSRSVRTLSWEWHGVAIDDTIKCAERLSLLHPTYRFNYCVGESVSFVLPQNADYKTMIKSVFPLLGRSPKAFGDLYAFY